jgi:glycosyltransferase involved in cell wall biosynthesis
MNVVIVDIEITGHHSEYIDHLIEYLLNHSTNDTYYFVVHPEFITRFKTIVSKTKNCSHIHWHPVKPKEIESLVNLSIAKKSFRAYRLVQNYAHKLKADIVYLQHFNIFQLALAFKRANFKIKGILFNQFFRMSSKSLKEKLKYFRKFTITKLYCLNPSVEKVFVLNDLETVRNFNRKFSTNIFSVLNDPIPNLTPLENFDIYANYGISYEKKILLHFGSLASRKGTLEIIEAAKLIPKDMQNEFTILLVGKPENSKIEKEIFENIVTSNKNSETKVIWDNNFVSNSTMKSLFDQCSAVVIPYKNPEASSGILGHAIAAKKPVITTGKGLLKALVEENNFGILLEEVNPLIIANAFLKISTTKVSNETYTNYLEEHTTIKFSNQLLN